MAARLISPEELKKALDIYCVGAGTTISEGEQDGKKRYLLSPGDIIIREEEGRLICGSQSTYEKLSEIIMEMRQGEPEADKKAAEGKGLVPKDQKQKLDRPKSQQKDSGSVIEDWRAKQDRTYMVEGGKEVPNAFAASEEANRRRINTETDSGRTETLAWGKARAIDAETGQYREAKVNFEWTAFRQKNAWEIARNMERKNPGIVKGIDEATLLPILDSSKSFKGQPPALYLHMQILNRWTFADRDAESKAERRAILKLANREWRDKEEVESEKEEQQAVQEARA